MDVSTTGWDCLTGCTGWLGCPGWLGRTGWVGWEGRRAGLLARGVDAAMLRATGFGAAQPIADNATEDGRAKNRRTTILWSE